MRRKTIKILIVFFALAFNSFGFDDSIEDGWKGIKLFRTNMATVEKILGEPKASIDNAYNYETDEFFIQVRYSSALCGAGRYGGGNYDVPLDTVTSYDVILDNPIKLADFKFKREKYKRQPDSERSNLIYYNNSEDAILIRVLVIDGVEQVIEITFYPSPADKKKFECRKPEAAVDKTSESKTVKTRECKKPE